MTITAASQTPDPSVSRHLARLHAENVTLRVENARLKAAVAEHERERADHFEELARRDDALHLAEDEIDALRHALGLREVPS